MKRDIVEFVAKCPTCKQVKGYHRKTDGLLQEIQIPTWQWEEINVHFVVGFPRTQISYDSIWVVIDRLTNSTRFITIMSTYSAKDYTRIFIGEILFRYGILLSIILDQGAQFT